MKRVTSRESRALADEERSGLTSRIDELVGEIDRQIDELIGEQESLEDAAREHLFVSAHDSNVVLEAISSTSSSKPRSCR